ILAVGLLGRATSGLLVRTPPADFLSMTESALVKSTPHLVKPNADQVSTFLSNQLGRSITIPEVRDAVLEGVGILGLGGGVVVPTLFYGDGARAESFKVAVFTYEQIGRL